MIIRILLSICVLCALVQAESVKSITGNIIIDVNNDGTSEAKLNSDGLAIGPGLSASANLHLQGNGIMTGDLVVGGTAGNSTLEIQGTVGYNTQTVSSNTTLSGNSIVLVDTSSDNVALTLPYAGNVLGRQYTIKKISTSNEVTLSGSANIDNFDSFTFSSGNNSYLNVISNGSQWYVLSKSSDGLSGVTLWTPANISTVAWFDANDASTLWADTSATTAATDGGTVARWDDKSGNGNNATRSTSSYRPTYTASDSQMNNMPSIGSTDNTSWKGLLTPDITAKNIYGVFYYKDGADSSFDSFSAIISGDTSNSHQRVMGSQSSDDWISTGRFNTESYKNGSTTDTLLAVLPMPASVFKFKSSSSITQTYGLGYYQTSDINRDWNGAYAEFVLTDGTEDSATEQKIVGYLAHKWGLAGSLDAGHPYKNSAP